MASLTQERLDALAQRVAHAESGQRNVANSIRKWEVLPIAIALGLAGVLLIVMTVSTICTYKAYMTDHRSMGRQLEVVAGMQSAVKAQKEALDLVDRRVLLRERSLTEQENKLKEATKATEDLAARSRAAVDDAASQSRAAQALSDAASREILQAKSMKSLSDHAVNMAEARVAACKMRAVDLEARAVRAETDATALRRTAMDPKFITELLRKHKQDEFFGLDEVQPPTVVPT
jgi:hypothetical protein